MSNAKQNVKEFKDEGSKIKKELEVLKKDAGKAESKMKTEYAKLEESSTKVESYKGERKFGQANRLFGVSKDKRVEKAETKATEAETKQNATSKVAESLTKNQNTTSGKIDNLERKQNVFKADVKDRLELAKDVHTAIKDFEGKHEALILKYEAKKESLASGKPPMKMTEESKAKIKEQLNKLEGNIKGLKGLEKDIGKAKLSNSKDNGEFNNAKNSNLRGIKDSFEVNEKVVNDSINNPGTDKMSRGDRISHFVGNLFSASNKTDNQSIILSSEQQYNKDLLQTHFEPKVEKSETLKENFNEINSTEKKFSENMEKSKLLMEKMMTRSEVSTEQKTQLSEISNNYENASKLAKNLSEKFENLNAENLTDAEKMNKLAEIYKSDEFKEYTIALHTCVEDINEKFESLMPLFDAITVNSPVGQKVNEWKYDLKSNPFQQLGRHPLHIEAVIKNSPESVESESLKGALVVVKGLIAEPSDSPNVLLSESEDIIDEYEGVPPPDDYPEMSESVKELLGLNEDLVVASSDSPNDNSLQLKVEVEYTDEILPSDPVFVKLLTEFTEIEEKLLDSYSDGDIEKFSSLLESDVFKDLLDKGIEFLNSGQNVSLNDYRNPAEFLDGYQETIQDFKKLPEVTDEISQRFDNALELIEKKRSEPRPKPTGSKVTERRNQEMIKPIHIKSVDESEGSNG